MRIRVFTAPQLHEALALVRRELGAEALILDRQRIRDAGGQKVWQVHAALDDTPAPRPAAGAADPHRPAPEIHAAMKRLERIVEELGNKEAASLRAALHHPEERRAFDHLTALGVAASHAFDMAADFAAGRPFAHVPIQWGRPVRPGKRCQRLLFTGPAGCGKTTLIAKLATRFSLKGVRIALASTDCERIGGADALAAYAATLGVDFFPIRTKGDAVRLDGALKSAQLLLVDSEGWSPRHDAGIAHQQRLWEAIGTSRRHLVLPANIDEEDGMRIIARQERIDATDFAITKLDETARPGKVVNWCIASGLPASWCSFGPEVPEQTGFLTPDGLGALLGAADVCAGRAA
ncbi:MAG: GTP-binding protein [Mariprofundaceae bacterium]